MQVLKEKRKCDESFQHYLDRFSFPFREATKKSPPDYLIESPLGKIVAVVLDYNDPSEIQDKLKMGQRTWKQYKKMKLPFMLALHKGGLPGLEHRFIQKALQNHHYPEISSVALLEGKPGHEYLRIFHNPFAKYPLDRRIFDHEKDKNLFLAKIFPNNYFWIVEDAL